MLGCKSRYAATSTPLKPLSSSFYFYIFASYNLPTQTTPPLSCHYFLYIRYPSGGLFGLVALLFLLSNSFTLLLSFLFYTCISASVYTDGLAVERFTNHIQRRPTWSLPSHLFPICYFPSLLFFSCHWPFWVWCLTFFTCYILYRLLFTFLVTNGWTPATIRVVCCWRQEVEERDRLLCHLLFRFGL